MASTKNVTKTATAPVKPAAPAIAKAKPATKTKAKPEPLAKAPAAPRTAPRSATQAAAAKPLRSRAKKPVGVPPEQRRNYIEMAAYYIAERRGFAPGNPLEDWVQAEAEIDRLLAKGFPGG